ncbi:hypothetical protein AZE42_07310 [Rhizopogon vesiculosus]|uniref:Uncharacterized protein n=1 Tax=Rhizopogon vesiculosus TaxID=180088 RepID=A0A1J8QKD6_9AGAM|nr:hypothetical protein AZE42_07310 [Rhizopogon vesiculosus]
MTLTVADTPAKVPSLCREGVKVLVHQFNLYRKVTEALNEDAPSEDSHSGVNIHASITDYFFQVLLAFCGEVNGTRRMSNETWRSAHLDYHFSMALLDNAFDSEEQASALKKIGLSWEKFRHGKVFTGVKQLQGRKFHDSFCKDGDNLCGGPHLHINSIDDMVSRTLDEYTAPDQVDLDMEESNDEGQTTELPPRSANTNHKGNSKISKDNNCDNILPSTTLVEKLANPRKSMEGGSCVGKSMQRAQGKGKCHTRVSQDEDSAISGVPKQDAIALTSREEDEVLQKPDYPTGYDDTELPPMCEGWDDWHRITFQKGRSHPFLKLATWFLLRSRQLAKIDVNSALDNVLIERHPADVTYDNDDEYYEALGMERMYSAIVNMEERPSHLTHLFHALGKLFDQSAMEANNPDIRPVPSPPTVVERILSDEDNEWLIPAVDGLHEECNDASLAVHDMEPSTTPVFRAIRGIDKGINDVKRKRTISNAKSPRKKQRGRGSMKGIKHMMAPMEAMLIASDASTDRNATSISPSVTEHLSDVHMDEQSDTSDLKVLPPTSSMQYAASTTLNPPPSQIDPTQPGEQVAFALNLSFRHQAEGHRAHQVTEKS